MRHFRPLSTHSIVALSALILSILIASCRQTNEPATPQDCCKGIVTVHVCDANGMLISDALVCLMQDGAVINSAMSDDSGNVRFGKVCEGEYRLNVSRDGFTSCLKDFTEKCNATQSITTVLAAKTAECMNSVMDMTVLDAKTGMCVAGAEVALNNLTAVSNAKGVVHFEHLAKGDYCMTISRDGYKTLTWTFPVFCDEKMAFSKSIEPLGYCKTASINFNVRDNKYNKGLAGVSVMVVDPMTGDVLACGSTDAYGNYCTPAVLQGYSTYSLKFSKAGYGDFESKIMLGDCAMYQQKVVL